MNSMQTEPQTPESIDTVGMPPVVDYLVAAFVSLLGLALLAGGSVVTFLIDRSLIADAVADGSLRSDLLSNADLVEVGSSLVTWTGMGLIATGAVMAIGGVAYAIVRRRAHRAAATGTPRSDYVANALVGAAVSALLTFVPFSPAIGGALAGYLERGASERTVSVGALSGVLMMAPVLSILAVLTGGLVFGALAIDAAALALGLGAVMLFALLVVAVTGAGLGALGGYIGGKIAVDRTG